MRSLTTKSSSLSLWIYNLHKCAGSWSTIMPVDFLSTKSRSTGFWDSSRSIGFDRNLWKGFSLRIWLKSRLIFFDWTFQLSYKAWLMVCENKYCTYVCTLKVDLKILFNLGNFESTSLNTVYFKLSIKIAQTATLPSIITYVFWSHKRKAF
jgi:hypothetical protein